MSNILKTIEFLKENPTKRFIRIVVVENSVKVGKQDIYFSDIPYEDLTAYIKKNLGTITKPTLVSVEIRIVDGSTSRKKDSYNVEISPDSFVALQNSPVPAPVYQPVVQAAEPSFFQNGGLGATLGLGFPQIMEMQRKSDRLTDKEEQLAELKEEHKDLKQENKLLEIDNRELKTKLSTAEAKETMAVMMVKAENKSFFESPAFSTLMEKAPELLAGIVAMKTGGVTAGALGAADVSETKNSFIEFVVENCSDEQVNYLGSVCGNIGNMQFMQELNFLITKYATV